MLLKELLSFVPEASGDAAIAIALAGAAIGAGLWLMGAKFSRHIIALICVGAGAILGMQAPRLYGWNMSGGGIAVAGAIAAGVAGVVMHRLLIGVVFGTAMSCWVGVGTLILCPHGQAWGTP